MEGKWYSSSANIERLSLTIKSLLLALVPLILIATKGFFNLDLAQDDVINTITAFTGLLSAAGIFYGVCRKLYLRFVVGK